MSDQQNMTKSRTLEGNWYEERFFGGDADKEQRNPLVRPRNDEIENIPRIRRQNKPDSNVFTPDQDDPDRFVTDKMRTFVVHRGHEETLTERRMHTSPEHLAEILKAEPTYYIPNYKPEEFPVEEQFKTTTQTSYKRYF